MLNVLLIVFFKRFCGFILGGFFLGEPDSVRADKEWDVQKGAIEIQNRFESMSDIIALINCLLFRKGVNRATTGYIM